MFGLAVLMKLEWLRQVIKNVFSYIKAIQNNSFVSFSTWWSSDFLILLFIIWCIERSIKKSMWKWALSTVTNLVRMLYVSWCKIFKTLRTKLLILHRNAVKWSIAYLKICYVYPWKMLCEFYVYTNAIVPYSMGKIHIRSALLHCLWITFQLFTIFALPKNLRSSTIILKRNPFLKSWLLMSFNIFILNVWDSTVLLAISILQLHD